MVDSLAAVIAELRAMPVRSRRAILRSLTLAEREMLEAQIDQQPVVAASDDRFSPWVATCIRHAHDKGLSDEPVRQLTPASRQALLRSVEAITGTTPTPVRKPEGAGRSLFDAVNGMVTPRKPRS